MKIAYERIGREKSICYYFYGTLRHETAKELSDILNRDIRGKTELSCMQGYSFIYKIGMASLLPHKNIEILTIQIFADGINTSGTDKAEDSSLYSRIMLWLLIQYYKRFLKNRFQKTFEGKILFIFITMLLMRLVTNLLLKRHIEAEKTLKICNLVRNLINNVSATIFILPPIMDSYTEGLREYNKVKLMLNQLMKVERFIFI